MRQLRRRARLHHAAAQVAARRAQRAAQEPCTGCQAKRLGMSAHVAFAPALTWQAVRTASQHRRSCGAWGAWREGPHRRLGELAGAHKQKKHDPTRPCPRAAPLQQPRAACRGASAAEGVARPQSAAGCARGAAAGASPHKALRGAFPSAAAPRRAKCRCRAAGGHARRLRAERARAGAPGGERRRLQHDRRRLGVGAWPPCAAQRRARPRCGRPPQDVCGTRLGRAAALMPAYDAQRTSHFWAY